MTYTVTLYSKPACMPCKMVKRVLDEGGVTYIEHDVTLDADAAQAVRDLGYTAVPVTTIELEDGLDHWHGFDRMRLRAVVQLAGRAA